MSHTGGTSGAYTFTCETSYRLLVLPQEDLPALTPSTRVVHRCPSVPVLLHWVGVTMLAAEGFAVFVCVGVES